MIPHDIGNMKLHLSCLTNTENFSRSMNQMQNLRLSAEQAFREFMGERLATANMPTREDVLDVAQALHSLDKRLANVESLLTTMLASSDAAGARAGPPRTRKPPAADDGAPGGE